MKKPLILLLAVFLFVVSWFEISDALRNDCITHRMVTICDWTKYVWALTPAVLGLYTIWTALRKKE
jgi:hypothetical protein